MSVHGSRRSFLTLAATTFGAMATPSAWAAAPALAFGLQTITVMPNLSRDMIGTLKAVRGIGYRDIETIGTLGRTAAELRGMMADADLRSHSHHVCPNSFYAVMSAWSEKRLSMAAVFEQVEATFALDRMPALIDEAIEAATVLGQDTIVWSNLLARDLTSFGSVRRLANAFEVAARRCQGAGKTFAFHNGSKGFAPIDGRRPYDLLLEWTDPRLVRMELDVFWAREVGIDPLLYLARHPGRYRLLHLKDMDAAGEIVGIGDGVIDFGAILDEARRAGVDRFYVEYDQAPHPLSDAAEALRRLTAMNSAANL